MKNFKHMITHSMTPREMFWEIKKDHPSVVDYCNAKANAFRRKVLKSTVFPVRAYSNYRSKRNNKWIVFFEARSKKHTGNNALTSFICYANMQNGYYVYFPTLVDEFIWLVYMFPPHFFKRYAERANINKTGIELIRHFFERNYTYMIKTEINENITLAKITTEAGIMFGQVLCAGLIILKTFISWDNTFTSQYDEFFPNTEIISEMKRNDLDILSRDR